MDHPLKVGTLSYGVVIKPAPLTIAVGLSVAQNNINVTVDDIPGLRVLLSPTFSLNPINDILTVAGTLADIFTSEISNVVLNHAKGISKTVHTVQPIILKDAGITLTFTPSAVHFADKAGMLEITSSLSVS